MQHTATRCHALQHAATHTAPHTLHTAIHCNTLQHAATRCNTLQHAATHLCKSSSSLQLQFPPTKRSRKNSNLRGEREHILKSQFTIQQNFLKNTFCLSHKKPAQAQRSGEREKITKRKLSTHFNI